MLNFEYKGISYGKYVEGEIEALNNAEAAHKLKEQKVINQKREKKLITKKVIRYLLIKSLWNFHLNKYYKIRDLHGEKK